MFSLKKNKKMKLIIFSAYNVFSKETYPSSFLPDMFDLGSDMDLLYKLVYNWTEHNQDPNQTILIAFMPMETLLVRVNDHFLSRHFSPCR